MSAQSWAWSAPTARDELRRYWRALRVLIHIGYGLCLALVLRAHRRPFAAAVRDHAQRWQQRLLTLLAAEVERVGVPDPGAGLVVSNHISWLDIPVLGAVQNVHFLSKAEVGDWPLIGVLAKAAGTLFIRRGGGESGRKAIEIAGHLRAGRQIIVFPEGTTSDGRQLRRFFAPLFQSAVDADVPVQPVVIQYLDVFGQPDTEPAFIGDDEFHRHLWRLLRRDHVRVRVLYLPALHDQDAESLCRRSRRAIAAHLPS